MNRTGHVYQVRALVRSADELAPDRPALSLDRIYHDGRLRAHLT